MNRFKLMALAICAAFAGQMNAMEAAAQVVPGRLARLAASASAARNYVADSKVGTLTVAAGKKAADAGRYVAGTRAGSYVLNNKTTTAKYAALASVLGYFANWVRLQRKEGYTWAQIKEKLEVKFGTHAGKILAAVVGFYNFNLKTVAAVAGKAGSLALAAGKVAGQFAVTASKAVAAAGKSAGSTALVAVKANKGKTGAAALVTAALAYAGYKHRAQLKAAGKKAGSFVADKARNAGSAVVNAGLAVKAKLPVRLGGTPAADAASSAS